MVRAVREYPRPHTDPTSSEEGRLRPIVDGAIEDYATQHSGAESAALAEVARATRETQRDAQMLVGRLEGRLLRMLVRLTRASRILEIGTYTGYSAIAMAEAMPPDGHIVTCDIDPEHAEIARANIATAGHAARIEVRLGAAIDTVRTLEGPFDLIFIDADKPSYPDYLDAAVPLLAPHGVIMVDNVLWSGRVLEPRAGDTTTQGLAAFNDAVAADPRLEAVMLPIRDGVTLITHAVTPAGGAS